MTISQPQYDYNMFLHVHKEQTDNINILNVAKILIYVTERKTCTVNYKKNM